MKLNKYKQLFTVTIASFLIIQNSVCAANNLKISQIFKHNKNAQSAKIKKTKKKNVNEIKLPPVIQGKPNIPFNQLKVLSIEDCVNYA